MFVRDGQTKHYLGRVSLFPSHRTRTRARTRLTARHYSLSVLLPNSHAVHARRNAISILLGELRLGLGHSVGGLDERHATLLLGRQLPARAVVRIPCGGVLGCGVGAGADTSATGVRRLPRRRARREGRRTSRLPVQARLRRSLVLVVLAWLGAVLMLRLRLGLRVRERVRRLSRCLAGLRRCLVRVRLRVLRRLLRLGLLRVRRRLGLGVVLRLLDVRLLAVWRLRLGLLGVRVRVLLVVGCKESDLGSIWGHHYTHADLRQVAHLHRGTPRIGG